MPSSNAGRLIVNLAARKPLLQMTSDELIQAYMCPLTLGVYMSLFLYGLFILSLFMYFAKFRRDTWMNRTVVILLACFTTVDTVSSAIRIFRITVLHPNNLAYILDVTQRPEDWLCTLFFLCTILLSQLFLCFRILSFARRMSGWEGPMAKVKIVCMAIPLALVWLACLGISIANCVVFYKTKNYMELLLPTTELAQAFRKTTLLQPCMICVMDLIIAIMMTMQYRKARTEHGESNRILDVLVTVVIRNGVLVAVVMVVQFVVTFTVVLWGNFLPLCYGKLHALTVLCILTEPRLAHSKFHQSQDTALEGGISAIQARTPHMDYTRPSQLASIGGMTESGGYRRRRRYSTSSADAYERRPSDLLPYDGDGHDGSFDRKSQGGNPFPSVEYGVQEPGRLSVILCAGLERPGLMARKISEAPTASSGRTFLDPGTPIYELKCDDVEMREKSRGGACGEEGLVVQVEEKDGTSGKHDMGEDEKSPNKDGKHKGDH